MTRDAAFSLRSWVEARDYEHATPEPLEEMAPGILAHINTDHVDAMVLLAKSQAGIEAIGATMSSVDRLGFTLRLKTSEGVKAARIPRDRYAQDTHAVLVEMVKQAR